MEDLTGKVFGSWTVLSRAANRVQITKTTGRRNTIARWLCRCVCGVERPVSGYLLRHHGSTNCGCVRVKELSLRLRSPHTPFRQVVSAYKRNARSSGVPFELTDDECRALFEKDCFYCSESPANRCTVRSGESYIYNGIDKVDPSRGYVFSNCVSCCFPCNQMKSDVTQQAFFDRCRKITEVHFASSR